MNARMSREMESMMDFMQTQISRAINSAISERIIPEIQSMMGSPPLVQHGIEPISSLNEDGVGNVWKNTKLTKKDSRSACDLRDHTDTTPYRKIQFDTSNQKYIFPALNISNNFTILDYDAHINAKIHVFKAMTVQELNTLHAVCELERTQFVTILAMSVNNPQLAGFLLTGIRSSFLYVEGSTAWLYDCPHFI